MRPHRAFRSLLWKEWRDTRTILLVAIALGIWFRIAYWIQIATSHGGALGIQDTNAGYGIAIVLFFLPIFILLLGADRFAGESQAGTLGHLVALPAGRGTVWAAKLLAGLAAAVVLCAATMAVHPYVVEGVWGDAAPWAYPLIVAACYAALFLAGFAASVLVRNPFVALLAGVLGLAVYLALTEVVFVGAATAVVRSVGHSDAIRFFSPRLFGLSMLVVIGGVSWWWFRRDHEASSRARRFGEVGRVLVPAILIPVALQVVANLGAFSLSGDRGRIAAVHAVSTSQTVAFNLVNRDGYGRAAVLLPDRQGVKVLRAGVGEIVSISADGTTILCKPHATEFRYEPERSSRLGRLAEIWTARAFALQAADDDDWRFYDSYGTIPLLVDVASGSSLTPMVFPNSTGTERTFSFWDSAWSPDGKRVVIEEESPNAGRLWCLGRDFDPIPIDDPAEVGKPERFRQRLLGWSPAADVFYYQTTTWQGRGYDDDGNRTQRFVCAHDFKSRKSTVIARLQGWVRGFSPAAGWAFVTEVGETEGRGPRPLKLVAVNLASGEQKVFFESPVGGLGSLIRTTSLKKRGAFVYVGRETGTGAVLTLYEPATDRYADVGEIPGFDSIMTVSPDERYVLCLRRSAPESPLVLSSVALGTGAVTDIPGVGLESTSAFQPAGAWALGPVLLLLKNDREIWSIRPDGTDLKLLYCAGAASPAPVATEGRP